jgi:hypothetical protein
MEKAVEEDLVFTGAKVAAEAIIDAMMTDFMMVVEL